MALRGESHFPNFVFVSEETTDFAAEWNAINRCGRTVAASVFRPADVTFHAYSHDLLVTPSDRHQIAVQLHWFAILRRLESVSPRPQPYLLRPGSGDDQVPVALRCHLHVGIVRLHNERAVGREDTDD